MLTEVRGCGYFDTMIIRKHIRNEFEFVSNEKKLYEVNQESIKEINANTREYKIDIIDRKYHKILDYEEYAF